MLDSLFSPIDWVLRQLGCIEGNLNWLGKPALAMMSVIAVQVWRIVPLAAVIIMAGLVAIPQRSTTPPRSTAPGSGASCSRSRSRSPCR